MDPPATLLELISQAQGDRNAIIVPELGLRVTYDALRRQVLGMAEVLAASGIHHSDRIASVLPNGLPALISFLASAIAGTAAPLNPAYPYEELFFFLGDTSAQVLLCPPHGADQARSAGADRAIRVFTVEMDSAGTVHLVEKHERAEVTPLEPDDVALVLHTSGSTGRPKRVPLRHCNLAVSAVNIANTCSLTPDDISLCIMPLFHIHGLVASTLAPLVSGGTVVLPTKFNPLTFWQTVHQYHVTWYSAVPTMHQLLLARAHGHKHNAGTLRFIRSASAPLAPEIIQRIEDVFGVPYIEAYGMTEASHQMSSNPLPPKYRKHGSVGQATGIQISIMDAEGKHLDRGERGEVVIQGPSVFGGYENNPEANAASFVQGWFRTGDQGFLDQDNYLHLTGRIKDLIIRGGENVAPREVDEVLLRHPAVAEAVTFAMPHPVLGEEVAAAVVLHQPGGATASALLKHCRERLAEYKAPKKIYIVPNIPLTATGKVRRKQVAAALLDGQLS
jgi:acyl-CoA synthetase (AMP-forming)/AMP-acid ligase II